ncbi:src homology 2 domain-containing transforming protein C [Clonorchis sinensis]|uniref:Src homology 2 domain-containing transforming protein C n=1 Tax=Clonorchis sinensis TaxID=79923 RepID=G7YY26_CLOSI|nr:src homology 2 domain-containing transforming protein C [Clonorchis sinensis]
MIGLVFCIPYFPVFRCPPLPGYIQQLFRHNLSMVSFASAGDSNSLDLFCYVAKDVAGERLCHTFDCPGGIAQEVITTLGQAFQLGFQDFQRTKSGDKAPASTLTNPSAPLDSNNASSLITFDTAPTDPFQSRAPAQEKATDCFGSQMSHEGATPPVSLVLLQARLSQFRVDREVGLVLPSGNTRICLVAVPSVLCLA